MQSRTLERGTVPSTLGRTAVNVGTGSSGGLADGNPISVPRPNTDCSERPSVAAAEPASRRAAASTTAASNSGSDKKPSARNGAISDADLSAVASGSAAKDGATATTTRTKSSRSAAKARAKLTILHR